MGTHVAAEAASRKAMGITYGILVFDGVEELDFAGPWEVFGYAATLHDADRLVAIAEHERPIRCAKGLAILPDHTFDNAPELDVVLVPGGMGTRTEVNNAVLIDWLRKTGGQCKWVTSVCTGVLLLHEAGLARGRRVTTHWSFVERLRERGNVTVVDDARYVCDGNLLTAAGVSAGIDMALWLLGQLYDPDFARQVQKYIEYYPEPPYGDA
jgi:transcriptional regulator GlxA family with amidase domain